MSFRRAGSSPAQVAVDRDALHVSVPRCSFRRSLWAQLSAAVPLMTAPQQRSGVVRARMFMSTGSKPGTA